MNEPVQEQRCCLCNIRVADSDEHVPPESWFGEPHPQLITVRACEDCNNGSSRDDEYMRAFLCSMDVPEASPSLDQVRQRAVQRLHRPDYPGLLFRLLDNAEVTAQLDPETGERMIVASALRPEPDRIMKTISKQARAMIYHLTGQILSPATFTMLERLWGLQTQPPEHWEMWTSASAYALANGRTDTVGDVFRYTYCEIQRSACAALLRLEYYGVFPYIVLIFRPDFAPPQRIRTPF